MYYLGIDIGGTNIKTGIVDSRGNILRKTSIKTLSERPYLEIISDMGKSLIQTIKEAKLDAADIVAVGIGSPGIIDSQYGIVRYNNNIGWIDVSLADEIKKYIDKPVFVHNDANAAALGEWKFGAGKGLKEIVLITLGTGVGGGVVIGGKLLEGNHSAGAELGHLKIAEQGYACTCGRKDCWEVYSSATALIRETVKAMTDNPKTLMWNFVNHDIKGVDGKTAFECAKKGDITAQNVVDRYLYYLGEGLINMANMFRPELLILGGGVCAQGDYLIKPLQERISKYIYGGKLVESVKISVASLGNDAGIIGAAALAINEYE